MRKFSSVRKEKQKQGPTSPAHKRQVLKQTLTYQLQQSGSRTYALKGSPSRDGAPLPRLVVRRRVVFGCCLLVVLSLSASAVIQGIRHWLLQTPLLHHTPRPPPPSNSRASNHSLQSPVRGAPERRSAQVANDGLLSLDDPDELNTPSAPSTWEHLALTRVLLAGTVVRATHLEEQFLLVAVVPCDAYALLARLHSRFTSDSAASLASLLPWTCVVAPGTPEQELLPPLAVTARDFLVHVRCPLPRRTPSAGTPVSVSVQGPNRVKSVESTWEPWALSTHCPSCAQNASSGAFEPQEEDAPPVPLCRPSTLPAFKPHNPILHPSDAQSSASGLGMSHQLRGAADLDKGTQQSIQAASQAVRQQSEALRQPGTVGLEGAATEGGAGDLASSQQRTLLVGSNTEFVFSGQEQGTPVASQALVASHAEWGDPSDTAFTAGRLVLEAHPQHEGLYLFSEGLSWPKNREKPASGLTCIYGVSLAGGIPLSLTTTPSVWKGKAIAGVPGDQKAVLCPYPPPHTFDTPAGERGGLTLPLDLVPVSIEDELGVLPTVAFFQPGAPQPDTWRTHPSRLESYCNTERAVDKNSLESIILNKFRKKKEAGMVLDGELGVGEERAKKKHFLCSCTMGWNVAKFLKEWTLFHSWMGVEHYFIYDNNSDDNLPGVAASLSASVPHPDDFTTPYRGTKSNGTRFSTVTAFPWPWLKTQQAGFGHCVLLTGPLCEWVMFTDVDEFIVPKMTGELKTRSELDRVRKLRGPFLRFLLQWSQKADCPAAIGQWQMQSLVVGPSGQPKHPAEGVTLGYKCRVAQHGDNKAIIRPEASRLELTHWIHLFGMGFGFQHCPRGVDLAILYHFKFQAWDEYKTKFVRRVAGSVGDWKKVYRPGQTRRSDGVVIKDGVAYPPDDWAQRYCQVEDGSLARLVKNVFAYSTKDGPRVPWQT